MAVFHKAVPHECPVTPAAAASHPLQSLSIQTTAFMSLDSLFCFPNKQSPPENDYFISSVTQIRRDFFFFPFSSSFLPVVAADTSTFPSTKGKVLLESCLSFTKCPRNLGWGDSLATALPYGICFILKMNCTYLQVPSGRRCSFSV